MKTILKTIALYLFCVVIAVGLAAAYWAIHGNLVKIENELTKETSVAQADFILVFKGSFSVSPRLEVLRDHSVNAYIVKDNFMAVPFPDRDAAIANVGKRWCEEEVTKQFMFMLPNVKIRDIRTGDTIASYYCIFH